MAEGYLPETFDPDRDSNTEDLRKIIEDFGKRNRYFKTDEALKALRDIESVEVERGDMFNVIAAGLGITYDPNDPFKVASELADRGILYGHDRDGDGVVNPYERPDADPDSTMNNEQLAAFLDRITGSNSNSGGNSNGQQPNSPGGQNPNNPGSPGNPGKPVDPDTQEPPNPRNPDSTDPNSPEDPDKQGAPRVGVCANGLTLDNNSRSRILGHLKWATLVSVKTQGEPGRPWPPHPSVPGGSTYLHLAGSPMWPVVSPQSNLSFTSSDGCRWQVASFEARLTQLVPWDSNHRAMIVRADSARPGTGFGSYLRRWDNLSAAQKAQAQRSHISADVNAPSCPMLTAQVSADSYGLCRWELATPGIWTWQANACFEADVNSRQFRDCETLAEGLEWFLEIIDYTSGITLKQASDITPASSDEGHLLMSHAPSQRARRSSGQAPNHPSRHSSKYSNKY